MAVKAKPSDYNTVTPFLYVSNVPRLLKFLKEAFGAEEKMQHLAPDGAVMHAEVKIGDSMVMMSERSISYPEMPCQLYLYVNDADEIYDKALDAGATAFREPADQFYGDRSGAVTDPCGNIWWISTHIEDVSPAEMQKRMEAMSQQPTT
jgi:PhnB protein